MRRTGIQGILLTRIHQAVVLLSTMLVTIVTLRVWPGKTSVLTAFLYRNI